MYRVPTVLGVRVGLADSSLTETHATDENCVIRQISSKFVNFVVCDTRYDKIQPPTNRFRVFFVTPKLEVENVDYKLTFDCD